MSLATSLLCSPPQPLCPSTVDPSPPGVDTFAYELLLPCSLAAPALARSVVSVLLRSHGLDAARDAVLQVTGELLAAACRFGGGAELRLSLSWQDDEVWTVVHDGHLPHRNPRLGARCEARREDALALLARVVDSCAGEWGHEASPGPRAGTRSWAALGYAGACAYGSGAGRDAVGTSVL